MALLGSTVVLVGCGAPSDPVERAAEMDRAAAAVTAALPTVESATLDSWMNGFVESVKVSLVLSEARPLTYPELRTLHTTACAQISWTANGMLVSAHRAQTPTSPASPGPQTSQGRASRVGQGGRVDLTGVLEHPADPSAGPATTHPSGEGFRVLEMTGGQLWLPSC